MKENGCIFCQKTSTDFILENPLAAAFWDLYPVNPGHLLIIPKNHRLDYFSLTAEEIKAINQLLFQAKERLDQNYHPAGYNLIVNNGHYGGQSIMHCHLHLIPRYPNDGLFMPKPRRR